MQYYLMLLPLLFIFAGLYIYYDTFGWTLSIVPTLGLYWATFFLVLGLILLVRRRA